MGQFELKENTLMLARCSDATMISPTGGMKLLPDVYDEARAIHTLHLKAGKHRIYVNFQQPFWCHLYADSTAARVAITDVEPQDASSPFLILRDRVISDVVGTQFVSPHVGIPVLNAARHPLRVSRVQVSHGPQNLTAKVVNDSTIASGQTMIVHLKLSGSVVCEAAEGETQRQLNLSLILYPEGENMAPAVVWFKARCWETAAQGFQVAYPDFDGSVQEMWVAPPNLTRFENRRCPDDGCPTMLSLHGAAVINSPNWGRNYEYEGEHADKTGFPYPAWLVEPTNRWKWGTDWEGQGLDNAIYAIEWVQAHLPGATCGSTAAEARAAGCGMDTDRVLVTGHSMGGHGCFVYTTHFADRLLGAACAAAWTSFAVYAGSSSTEFLDQKRRSLNEFISSEHSADLLASNAHGVPMLVIYGSLDSNVPPPQTRYMARLVDSFSADRAAVTVEEVRGSEHWFTQNHPTLVNFIEGRLNPDSTKTLPLPELPLVFELMVTNPKTFGSRGLLRVMQLSDASMPGRLFVQRCTSANVSSSFCKDTMVEVNAKNDSFIPALVRAEAPRDPVWDVSTFNVKRFRVEWPTRMLPRNRSWPSALRIDGQLFTGFELNTTGHKHFCKAAVWAVCGGTEEGVQWELVSRGSPLLASGPVHMAIRQHPVCIVHGTGADQAEVALSLANKMYFISRYAVPIIDANASLSDSWVCPDSCRDAHLLLVGGPVDNSWSEHFQCTSFPYMRFANGSSVQNTSFSLGGYSYSEDGTGVLALGPLPNGRLALLIHGVDSVGLVQAALNVPVSAAKHGSDFTVFGPDSGWKGEGGILASGYLNETWGFSSSSGWVEPEHATRALLRRPTMADEFSTECPQLILRQQRAVETSLEKSVASPLSFFASSIFAFGAFFELP